MFKNLRFIATLACLSLSVSVFAEDLVFINDDLRAGLNRASGEGKLVFLEFWASYCTPCKMMEEYTFTNASVIERMTNNYVPVKVNIQSFDGFDLKNQYKVTVLPTIIILDSKGHQVGRYEETMAPTKLNSILDKHNVPQNRNRPAAAILAYNNNNTGFNTQANKITSTSTPSVSTPVTNRTSVAYSSVSTSAINRAPTTAYNTAAPVANRVPVTYNTTAVPATNRAPTTAYNSVAPAPTNRTPVVISNNTTPRKLMAALPTANATAEVGQRREMPVGGFTIQAGAYAQAVSAQMAVEEMKSQIGDQKQYIMRSKTANGKITFRILIGNFASRQQADIYRKKVAIEGFVRGFDEFAKK